MELLDRVDAKDRVIGTTNKIEAHEKGYAHRVVAVFVFTSDGSLLVQLRKKDGLLDHSVGGHVRRGESYDEGVVRESGEELGITKKLERVGTFYSNEIVPRGRQTIVHYFGLYEVRLTDAEMQEITLAEDEVERVVSMRIEEIAEGMTKTPEKYTTGFMATLNYYIETHGLAIPSVTLQ